MRQTSVGTFGDDDKLQNQMISDFLLIFTILIFVFNRYIFYTLNLNMNWMEKQYVEKKIVWNIYKLLFLSSYIEKLRDTDS